MSRIPIGSIEQIHERKKSLEIEEMLSLEKAFKSDDVGEIMKAQNYLEKRKSAQIQDHKTILVDPYDLSGSLGYKDKPQSVSYDLLRGMAKTHIIKSIIETRKDQIISFCSPQSSKYSTGFIVRKRITLNASGKVKRLTKKEEKEIEDLTMFILNCGNEEDSWSEDSFEPFTKKVMDDSLTLDQATFEIVRSPHTNETQRFLATDGGTMRISDTYGTQDDDSQQWRKRYNQSEMINGHLPSYVQIIDGKPVVDYYPWELCFGVRNPSSNIRSNGYGRSELEDMIQTVTSLLNSDHYNANFFKVGSSPKGILSYSGNVNETTLQDFRAQWMAQTAGVMNMHKIPLINADKINFIPTHVPNKDMEFSKFQEFLIKISCALYKIDPSEIGFPMSGSSDAKPMFEGKSPLYHHK